MTRKQTVPLAFVLIFFVFSLYGGGCDSGNAPRRVPHHLPELTTTYPSAITGSAVKGPIFDATIQLFYFGEDGAEVEIVSSSAPVRTDSSGAFSFPIDGNELMGNVLMGITSPLIVRSSGGTMYSTSVGSLELEAIIADPQPLTFNNVELTCHLSLPSSVAAGLLRNYAEYIGTAPTLDDANEFMDLVESQLRVDLTEDPADTTTLIGMFNDSIDMNLDLEGIPASANVAAVQDLIDYFIANISSSSGLLDDQMDDTGIDIPASFTGDLSSLFTGPADFILMSLVSDKEYIENNAIDTANITVTLMDAAGRPYQDLDSIDLGKVVDNAPGILTSAGLSYARGEVRGELTSLPTGETGEVLIRAEYVLANINEISLEIGVSVLDYATDNDGDGLSDGIESETRYILIDTGGFGLETFADKLEKRGVWSDPGVADTDMDGLDDYTEYLLNTDPRSADTDGDGLTDEEEVNRWKTNPLTVDSDYDAGGLDARSPNPWLFDGSELAVYRTSPSLQDTDADGRSDFEEIFLLDRNPLVSNLPKLEMEIMDAVDVRLDVTYAEEAGSSYEYGSEMMKSEEKSHSYYNEKSMEVGIEIGFTKKFGTTDSGVEGHIDFHANYGRKWSTTDTSSHTTQESHSEYTTDSRTRTETAATGSMTTGIRLTNSSNIAFSLSKMGITVRHGEQAWDEEKNELVNFFRTLATLVPSLGDGVTLAPGESTPVLQVAATGLNPDRVKAFLKRPDSLYLEDGYFEMEDANGVNFNFLKEITATRTATVIIDPGQNNTEEYRVATNVQRGEGGTYLGVPLGDVLSNTLDIDFTTIGRQRLDDSAPSNERVLFRLRDLENNLDNPDADFWAVVHESENPPAGIYDFEEIPVQAGDRVLLIYVRDTDQDGVIDLEEEHYGTHVTTCFSDTDCDNDGLTDSEELAGWQVSWTDSSGGIHEYDVVSDPTNADQDQDGWNDSDEKNAGTGVGTDPSNPDTDRDGMPDGSDHYPLDQAKVLYVDQNRPEPDPLSPDYCVTPGTCWSNAFADLQAALDIADDGYDTQGENEGDDDVAEIWVAAGIYHPTECAEDPCTSTERAVSFELVPNVGLYGGFVGGENKREQRNSDPRINGTELSGDLLGDDVDFPGDYLDNTHTILKAGDLCTQSTVIDGFLISGAYNNTAVNTETTDGGGMMIWPDGAVTLRNLFFQHNQSNHHRGAGCIRIADGADNSPEITISNSVFSDNIAIMGGAITLGYHRKLRVEACQFFANWGYWGGAINAQRDSSLIINKSDFYHNTTSEEQTGHYCGGAIRISSKTARIEYSRFIGNEARYRGGAIYGNNAGNVEILQCLFSENEVTWEDTNEYTGGGAICFVDGTSLSVVNSTIINNTAAIYASPNARGGGILGVNNFKSIRIENSILWNNKARNLNRFGWQVSYVTSGYDDMSFYSNSIEGLDDHSFSIKAYGNTGDDPMFNDSNGVTLQAGSPCIDTGNTYADYQHLTSGFQTLPYRDLAENLRIVDGDADSIADVDMGAYEYQP